MFRTVGAAKHVYDALNMRNVFRKIPRRECDVAEEGQWRRGCRTSPSVHRCNPPTPSTGDRGVVHWKVKGAVNSLKSAVSGLTPAKREANSSLKEATTLTQVSGSTSSGTQAAM